MKLGTFFSRLQELNEHLGEFPHETPEQETTLLPIDKIMDIIYHFMPIIRKKRDNLT